MSTPAADPNGFDHKLQREIEARLKEIESEKAKYTEILRVLRGDDSHAATNRKTASPRHSTLAPFAFPSQTEPVTNVQVVEAAMKSLDGKSFNIDIAYEAVLRLPFAEALRLTRPQVRNAFRKIVVRPNSPIELAKKGVGSSGDFYRWKGN
jgi:hypothetical protein